MATHSKISFWGKLKLGQKIAIIPAIFILAVAGIIYYTITTLQNQKNDTVLIDIAGQQRSLIQEYFKDILLTSRGYEVDYHYSGEVMDKSLEALLNGGVAAQTFAGEERVQLPPAPTNLIREKLMKQKQLIDEIKVKAGTLLGYSLSDPAYSAELKDLRDLISRFHNGANDVVKLYSSYSQSKIAKMIRFEIALGVVVAFLGILFSWLVVRSIAVPLSRLMETARQIGQGNLRPEKLTVTSTDEVGQLAKVFNDMLDYLKEMAVQTRALVENLNSATAEILAATQQQASSTNEQAASVQQTATTMDEISQSGIQISEKSKQVAGVAESTSTTTNMGLQAVQEMNSAMDAIREQAEAMAEKIVSLSEKNQTIGEIIAAVNEIAEQSNLLALNAAIEAASAGEQGRSFTVVANEMKNLADQAKTFTVQVKSILEEIQKGINSSVMLTEETVKRIESGKQKSDIAEETIQQMNNRIQESIQAFQQIVGATNQQQIGFEQVTLSLKDISKATEQSISSTSQLEKAAANLNALGEQLRATMERYQV